MFQRMALFGVLRKLTALWLLLQGSSLAFSPKPLALSRQLSQSTFSGGLLGRENALNTPQSKSSTSVTPLLSKRTDEEEALLGEKFGGYTVKQRLREEVESPFRQVRLFFFASSALSAFVALYFSSLAAFKAYIGGYSDVPPLDEALTTCGINGLGVAVCAALALREYRVGEANLERIARGGALARLVVTPATSPYGADVRTTLAEYRRKSRVLIAAGGREYISDLCRSLNADQLADENTLPSSLANVDVIVVPVLLKDDKTVGDTRTAWTETVAQEGDRNFDVERANPIVAFPAMSNAWSEYLQSEIETAENQGFDTLEKGITIMVKYNGRILRRATGQPQWGNLVGAMEVMDGAKFGMPGDSEKYGGP